MMNDEQMREGARELRWALVGASTYRAGFAMNEVIVMVSATTSRTFGEVRVDRWREKECDRRVSSDRVGDRGQVLQTYGFNIERSRNQMLENPNVYEFRCTHVQMFTSSAIHEFRCSRVQMFTSSDVYKFGCSRVQMFMSLDVHEFNCSQIQMFTNSDVHEFR